MVLPSDLDITKANWSKGKSQYFKHKKCQFSKSQKQNITLQKHILLIIGSLHKLPLEKISKFWRNIFSDQKLDWEYIKVQRVHQLQRVHKCVIPNCKIMLNVLYHIPRSRPKVVLRWNKGDTDLVSLQLCYHYSLIKWHIIRKQFSTSICSFALKNVLQKTIATIFDIPLAPFYCANFEKQLLSGSRIMRMVHFGV